MYYKEAAGAGATPAGVSLYAPRPPPTATKVGGIQQCRRARAELRNKTNRDVILACLKRRGERKIRGGRLAGDKNISKSVDSDSCRQVRAEAAEERREQ